LLHRHVVEKRVYLNIWVYNLQSEILNKSLNNNPISQGEMKSLTSASLGSGWIRLHPQTLENIPEAQQAFASISSDIIKEQFNSGMAWEALIGMVFMTSLQK
jgi:hypothetical protein